MFKKITLAARAMLFTVALAQNNIAPTTGSGDDQVGVGPTTASVQQNVNLILPPAVALHLDVSELDFDIGMLGDADAPFVCVYGSSLTDVGAGTFNGQMQTLPLGTYYIVNQDWSATNAPTINLTGHTGLVESYPPVALDDEEELVPGSKNYFMCYQTFILQKFSNHSNWRLSVTRSGSGAFDMYIQDNSYCSFNAGQGTGFYKIANGGSVNLLPANLTNNTTGNLAAACQQGGKSWLDDLVVVAVKVNGDPHGTNTAVLTYTIAAVVPN